MKFADLHTDVNAVRALRAMVDSGRVPHAILLHEEDGGGAVPLAVAFLQYLYCRNRRDGDACGECAACNKVGKLIHPDIHFIFPLILTGDALSVKYAAEWRSLVLGNPVFTEGDLYGSLGFEGKNTVIGTAEVGALLRTLNLNSLEGGYTSVLVYLPEKMNLVAANKLLKILEEPPARTQFVMVTHAPEKLLPTILSRCQLLRLHPSGDASALRYDDGGLFAELMDAMVERDLPAALLIGERLASLPSRDNARSFCRFAAEKVRRMFLMQQGLEDLAGEDPAVAVWAGKCRKTFPRKALEILDRTDGRIGRNVNLKILFTDLVDRMFVNI